MLLALSAGSGARDRPRRRVLVVDDVPEIGEFYRAVLRRCKDFDITAAIEVRSDRAIERIREERFDLVITDFRMPRFTGADVIRAAVAAEPATRCVLMSGYLEASAGQLSKTSVDAVIAKPLRATDVIALIERLLAAPDDHAN